MMRTYRPCAHSLESDPPGLRYGTIEDCQIDPTAVVYHPHLVNLYGCTLGPGVTVGPFVEIQRGVKIGAGSKICSHAFICSRVHIQDNVFVGHGVMFTNDIWPVIGGPSPEHDGYTRVCDRVAIGSGAVILPGVHIGFGAIVGAGAVVVRNAPDLAIVAGNPARVVRQFGSLAERDEYIGRKRDRLHGDA